MSDEQDLEVLWTSVLAQLATDNRITPQLRGFLDLVHPRGIMAGVLYLEVPNELTRGMLEQRVRIPLNAAIESTETDDVQKL
jgi:hypothetical protein